MDICYYLSIYSCIYIRYLYMYWSIYLCFYLRIYIYIYIWRCIYLFVYLCLYLFVCIYLSIYEYISNFHMYICTYIQISIVPLTNLSFPLPIYPCMYIERLRALTNSTPLPHALWGHWEESKGQFNSIDTPSPALTCSQQTSFYSAHYTQSLSLRRWWRLLSHWAILKLDCTIDANLARVSVYLAILVCGRV